MDAQPKSRASVDHEGRNGPLLAELLAQSGLLLRSQARRNAPSAADAEDALQDACVQFLRHYGGPLERSAALPWMLLVTKRCAWQSGRVLSREEPSFESGLPEGTESQAGTLCPQYRGPAELAEAAAELSERRELLGRLKRDERRAIVLVGLGYSYEEICERYGWTHTKINRCLSEGRAALREMEEGRHEPS
jgi:DNA-directed RNA polymerase specialized sigma24 family protein